LPVFGGGDTAPAKNDEEEENYLLEEPLARQSIGGGSSRYRGTPKFDGQDSEGGY